MRNTPLINEPDGCIKTGAYVYNLCYSVLYYGDLFKRGDVVFMRIVDIQPWNLFDTVDVPNPAAQVHAVIYNYAETFDMTDHELKNRVTGTLIAYTSTVKLLTYDGIEWSQLKPHLVGGTLLYATHVGDIRIGKEEPTD